MKLMQTEGMADLTDAQWEYLRPFVEWEQKHRQRPDRRGGRFSDARRVLDGVLWILRTGAPWHDLPPRYGPYQTCHRRFQQSRQAGVLDGILCALCEDLLARGELGLEETFIDAGCPIFACLLWQAKVGSIKAARSAFQVLIHHGHTNTKGKVKNPTLAKRRLGWGTRSRTSP